MMHKEYITPQIEIVEFDTEDVITTSNPNNGTIDFPITPIPPSP